MNKLAILALVLLLTSGCVNKLPLVSHAHMGHTLTTWHDTPEQQGLFIVAAKETQIAFEEISLAASSVSELQQRQLHLMNAVNALNADAQPLGTGLGYGAIRALEGAIDHLEYAASSEDASDNMITSMLSISEIGDDITQRLKSVQTLAHRLATQPQSIQHNSILNLQHTLRAALVGIDGDSQTLGMQQLDLELKSMLARETDPPYEPVSRRYVLGLVKLPNGTWGFRLPRKQSHHSMNHGNMGYGRIGGY